MPLERDENGNWRYIDNIPANWNRYYAEALPKYLTYLEPAFMKAREVCEFEFLLTLLRVRGIEDAGWDPYETSLRAIKLISKLSNDSQNWEAQRHLGLWLYGHIVEASEPYEMLANLIEISMGDRFRIRRFPPHKSGRPQSPGEKIRFIKDASLRANMPQVAKPLEEIWDRELRNAIFHSDYVIYGNEIRILSPAKTFSHEEITSLINKAIAYFDSIKNLYYLYIQSYKEPVIIDVHPEFSKDPNEKAVVIVREGHGAIGIKDNWTQEELRQGKIPYRIGRFYPEEQQLLETDPTLSLLPPRK